MPAMALPSINWTRMPAHFSAIEHDVVGPAEIAGDAGGFGDGFDGGESDGQGERGRGIEHDGAVDAVRGRGVPGVAVAALSGGLLIGDYYRAARKSRRRRA